MSAGTPVYSLFAICLRVPVGLLVKLHVMGFRANRCSLVPYNAVLKCRAEDAVSLA